MFACIEECEYIKTQKYIIREEETKLSHKSIQRGDYTQWKNANVEGKEQELVITMNMTRLVCEDNHKEEKEKEGKHSDGVLIDYDEELNILEEWLINPKACEDYIGLHILKKTKEWRHKLFKGFLNQSRQ